MNMSVTERQMQDYDKVSRMKKMGRTVISVPCWWNKSVESILATIYKHRPDLILNRDFKDGAVIPDEPPANFFKRSLIPDVGEVMQACFFSSRLDNIQNWWMGEKFDGIRAVWNPKGLLFYSKQCLIIPNLELLQNQISLCFYDGELWFGRKNFIYAATISSSMRVTTVPWEFLRYMIFDNPSSVLGNQTFELRYKYVLFSLPIHPYFIPCPRLMCLSHKHKKTYLRVIITCKGEGVMLRQPDSPYERGKSRLVLKDKNMVDVEASVESFQGNLCICKLRDDTIITTTKSNKLHMNVGDIVTIDMVPRYMQNKSSLPKITKIRYDLF